MVFFEIWRIVMSASLVALGIATMLVTIQSFHVARRCHLGLSWWLPGVFISVFQTVFGLAIFLVREW